MPINSSSNRKSEALAWGTFTVDWPVEIVVAEVEVTAPRELTLFEWAVARILDCFNEPPTLAEAAKQLGVIAPVFLRDALDTLLQLGAIEHHSSEALLDLPDCRLTSLGRQLLNSGRTNGLPERHGLHLHFDAITGEHLPKPRNLRVTPVRPVVKPTDLGGRLTEIGVDRMRLLAQAQGEPNHQGESRITGAKVVYEAGGHKWYPIDLNLEIDSTGVLHARPANATPAQKRWAAQRDVIPLNEFARASSGSWANGRCQSRATPLAPEKWFADVARLIAPAVTVQEARSLVQSARAELVLHPGWLDAPGFEASITEAAEQGVRCYLCGAEPSLNSWTEHPDRAPGFVVAGGAANADRPLAIVADGEKALRVDLVCARTEAGMTADVEIAAFARKANVPRLRRQLLDGVAESLEEADERHAFAIFALSGNAAVGEAGAQRIWDQTSGLDRVAELRRWSEWAQHLAGEDTSIDWLSWPVRAWQAAFDMARRDLNGQLSPLLDAAVGLVSPSDVLARLVQGVEPEPVWEDEETLRTLLLDGVAVCQRWSDCDPIEDCPAFADALRQCLSPAEAGHYESVVQAAMQTVVRTPQLSSSRAVCAWLVYASLPQPRDPVSLAAWLEAHRPLKRHLGPAFHAQTRQHLSRVGIRQSASAGGFDPSLRGLREAWEGLGLPAGDLDDRLKPNRSAGPAGERIRPQTRNQRRNP